MKPLQSMLVTLLPPAAVMHLRALDHYMHGEPELRLLKKLVDPHRQAVDAGANIGTYAYFLKKLASAVFAYEPNPQLAARLTTLMPTVRVRQVALSDKPANLLFSVPVGRDGRPRHELGSVAQEFSGQVDQFTVQCITIDSEALQDVGFMKIDVEQHEREVLRGAMQTILRCRPVILIEIYPLKYHRSIEEEFSFVLQHDYFAWFMFADAWLPMTEFRADVHAVPEKFCKPGEFMGNNLILFPQEHPLATMGP